MTVAVKILLNYNVYVNPSLRILPGNLLSQAVPGLPSSRIMARASQEEPIQMRLPCTAG